MPILVALPRLPSLLILLVVLVILLAGCEAKKPTDQAQDRDPAVGSALGDEIMVDPDLARQNPVLTGGGPASALIPPEGNSAEAIAAARAAAAKLAGGRLQHASDPQTGSGAAAGQTAALTARVVLGKHGAGTGQDCAAKVDYTMAWAAKLPAPFPVYPRGHVQEAAGTDADGCRLRVVNFVTPVPLGDVTDFYWTRARTAGFTATHRLDGGDHVIDGTKGAAACVVYLRTRGGLTEVDLVTNGG